MNYVEAGVYKVIEGTEEEITNRFVDETSENFSKRFYVWRYNRMLPLLESIVSEVVVVQEENMDIAWENEWKNIPSDISFSNGEIDYVENSINNWIEYKPYIFPWQQWRNHESRFNTFEIPF